MTTKVEKCKRKKVELVMREYKEGSLKRRNGLKVKNPKEAIAIALNVSRKKCSRKSSKKLTRKY
jgi:hypothetical protein